MTRRFAVASILICSLLGVSACGESGNANGSGNTDVATGGARFGTADEETAKLGSDAEPGEFPRTVTHSEGETVIPAKPERVVVLDTGELDAVLALNLTPVGMTTTAGEKPVPSYLADRVGGVTTVGALTEINLEAVADLKPDLILGSTLRAAKLYPQLAAIAPTVFSIRPGFPWKENFLLIGDALGMEAEATADLNAYADAVEKLKGKVDTDQTISLVRFSPKWIRLYGTKSLIGVVLADVGLARPANQNVDDLAVEISEENLGMAAGDFIFYTSYGSPDATGESAAIATGTWKNLQAVKDGNVQRVDDDVWYMGLGPIGAGLVVEQLTDYLTAG